MKFSTRFLWSSISLTFAFCSSAAIIVVDNAGDSGELENNCSLRDALLSASINISVDSCNAGEADVTDLIIIQVPGPIQLQSTIPVFDSVSIATNFGASKVTVVAADDSRIFRVNAGVGVNLNFAMANLKLKGGDAGDEGGGAINFNRNGGSFGAIEFRDMVFENNTASSGGALRFDETSAQNILIQDSEFLGNTATAGVGGAIAGFRISAIQQTTDVLEVNRNLFQNNHSSNSGGAIFINTPGDFSALFSSNYFIANSTDIDGGALSFASFGFADESVIYKIQRNLFMFNQAAGDGGAVVINTGAIANISRSIIAYNRATEQGGGIHTFRSNSERDNSLRLSTSTVVHNQAAQGDNISLTNTLFRAIYNVIAYPVNGDNCWGIRNVNSQPSLDNIVNDDSCEMLNDFGSTWIEDPQLSGFTNNPDYFPGFQPTANSPALDRGTTLEGTDFNGNISPTDGTGLGTAYSDLGAHEAPADTDLIWQDSFGF